MAEKPDYVVNFSRPPGTEIKNIKGGWYLYETMTVADPRTGQTRKKSGRLLGKVTENGFVPSAARQREQKEVEESLSRTRMLLGEEGMEALRSAHVAVFGVGGVGGYVVEALARSGVGHLTLVDNDQVSLTNLNRQIIALHSTIGRYKVDVARERILDINPTADVKVHRVFFGPDTVSRFDFTAWDYIVDAIDTVTAKLLLVEQARAAGTAILSCMGAGNKMDPTAFEVTDISRTTMCPLARVMRRELRRRGIYSLKVVYSREEAMTPGEGAGDSDRHQVPGSNAFVPATAGLIAASQVVRDLTGV